MISKEDDTNLDFLNIHTYIHNGEEFCGLEKEVRAHVKQKNGKLAPHVLNLSACGNTYHNKSRTA